MGLTRDYWNLDPGVEETIDVISNLLAGGSPWFPTVPRCLRFQKSALILFLHMNHSQHLTRSPLPPRSALSVTLASQGPVYKAKNKAEENQKC